ncbi:MAG TPA: hypothetical protein VF316_06875 [Polyangiaceae bacterium]
MRSRAASLTLLALGATFLGLAIADACSIYDPSLLLGDAAVPDAAPDTAQGDADTCGSARWPARPDKDDPSTKDYEFYEAVMFLDFGVADAGVVPVYGFNLDGFCTCPMPDSCKPAGSDGGGPPKHCDDEAGVDNSGGALIRQFSSTAGFFNQTYINEMLGKGVFGALFRVRGYNGQANDTKVELSVYVSNGTEGIQKGLPTIPQLDGNDKWTIDPASLLGGTIPDGGAPVPNTYDLNAYVSNGYLVANLDFPLGIGAGNGEGLVTVELSGSVIVAKLEPYQGVFRANGIVGGRWPTTKLLKSIAVLHDPFDYDASLCGTNPTYQALKPKICSYADITKNPVEDGKNAPCDSISIGFKFESTPATFGGVFGRPDSGTPCGPQWTDECAQ